LLTIERLERTWCAGVEIQQESVETTSSSSYRQCATLAKSP